jgi:4,5-dihydroxyphthalate decarboxylase
MLRDGELDAAIYGADLPDDPSLASVIASPEQAALEWYARHGVVPINHMVVVTERLLRANPEAVQEVFRLLAEGKRRAVRSAAADAGGAIDFLPFGVEACRPALETVIAYALQQSLIPRKMALADLFEDTTASLVP